MDGFVSGPGRVVSALRQTKRPRRDGCASCLIARPRVVLSGSWHWGDPNLGVRGG